MIIRQKCFEDETYTILYQSLGSIHEVLRIDFTRMTFYRFVFYEERLFPEMDWKERVNGWGF